MKSYFLNTLWFALAAITISCKSSSEAGDSVIGQQANTYKVIAYVHGWQDMLHNNAAIANKITHINFAFANIKDGKVILGKPSDSVSLVKLNRLKNHNPNLKILISVGGWSWSKNFSDAALTPESREVFADSAIDFMLAHKIDGIDLDWEYPGQKGDNNIFRPEDKENFTAILKLIREKLEALSPSTYLLTIATGANQLYLDHTDMAAAHRYLDFINIMTYDFYTAGENQTGHHSSLYKSDVNGKAMYAAKAVQQHINAGIPVEKLVLGVPFYGRWWKGTNPEHNGLYQNSTGDRGSYGFSEIEQNYIGKNGFLALWDNSAKAPYLWNEKEKQFVTYEDPKSLKHKIEFIKEKNMGGIMFWQLYGDSGTLLNTIDKYLK